MKYLKINEMSGKQPFWVNLDNITGLTIKEMEVKKEADSKIIVSEGTLSKAYIASLLMIGGLAFNVKFDSMQEAEKFLTDQIINA